MPLRQGTNRQRRQSLYNVVEVDELNESNISAAVGKQEK